MIAILGLAINIDGKYVTFLIKVSWRTSSPRIPYNLE